MPQKALQLYKVYLERMMRQPYSWHIIPQYKKLGQGRFGRNNLPKTTIVSYLPTTVIVSYLTLTVAVSYLLLTVLLGVQTAFIPSILVLGFAVHSGDEDKTTLDRFIDSDEVSRDGRRDRVSDKQDVDRYGPFEIAYIYARQSQEQETDKNEETSSSIDTQVANGKKCADEHDRKVVGIYRDRNESGFTFERDEFQKLVNQIQKQPGTVTLDRINRLGRNALETIFVVGKLHYEYDVPISTHRHGDYDFNSLNDQIILIVNAITAGKSVKDRIRSAWDTIWNRFKEQRKWYTWFDKVPIGYQAEDGGDWIEPHPKGAIVVEALLRDLRKVHESSEKNGAYTPTKNLVQDVVSNESLEAVNASTEFDLATINRADLRAVFDASDYKIEELSWQHIKRIATNHVYIGEIRIPRSAEPDDQEIFEDQELAIVDEELFNEVLKTVVGDISDKYSKGNQDVIDTATLADHGLILTAEEASEIIKPVCPECNRGMPKNRQEDLSGGRSCHYYICPQYKDGDSSGHHGQKKFPKQDVWETLKSELERETEESTDVVVFRVC